MIHAKPKPIRHDGSTAGSTQASTEANPPRPKMASLMTRHWVISSLERFRFNRFQRSRTSVTPSTDTIQTESISKIELSENSKVTIDPATIPAVIRLSGTPSPLAHFRFQKRHIESVAIPQPIHCIPWTDKKSVCWVQWVKTNSKLSTPIKPETRVRPIS